jgi:hypothetical protein
VGYKNVTGWELPVCTLFDWFFVTFLGYTFIASHVTYVVSCAFFLEKLWASAAMFKLFFLFSILSHVYLPILIL